MADHITPMLPGKVTATAIAQTLPRYTQSGDVHIAVYDWDHDEPALLVAIGTTSANNTYVGKGGRPAWAAPHVELGLLEMQSGRDGAARVALDVATELDPYNTRAAFSEFLLEEIESFEVLESENFILKYRAGEDAVVAKGMLGPLEAMHADLVARFKHEPDQKTVIELMPDH